MKYLLLISALALGATACGSAESAQEPAQDVGTEELSSEEQPADETDLETADNSESEVDVSDIEFPTVLNLSLIHI